MAWGLNSLVTSQLGDDTRVITNLAGSIVIPDSPGASLTIQQYLDAGFGFRRSFLGPAVTILVAFAVLLAALAIGALKFLHYVSSAALL